ncbi:MAG: hypothetical protein AAB558_04755 [Patescibacteria group bacterium]
MFIFKRIIPFLACLITLGLSELTIREGTGNPGWWALSVALVPLLYQVWLMPKRVRRLQFWGLGIPLWLFGLGSMVVLLYVPGTVWQHVVAVVSAGLIGLYLETEFSYLYRHSKYVPFSMERMGEMMLAAGAGMTCMGMLGLDVVGLIKTWQTVLLAVAWAVLISASSVYMYRLPKEKTLFIFSLGVVALFQLYWVLQFLPITFVVTGAIAGITVASFFTLTRYAMLESLDRKTLWRTLTTSGTAVVILLLTTRWT